jgi:hypothetical protein
LFEVKKSGPRKRSIGTSNGALEPSTEDSQLYLKRERGGVGKGKDCEPGIMRWIIREIFGMT